VNIETIAPYLTASGFGLVSIDADETGPDDVVGQFLMYGGEAVTAINAGEDLPTIPDTLAGTVAGQVSTKARVTLTIVGMNLSIAQVQTMTSKPKLSKVLRYVTQGISAILAGRTLPTAPVLA
jgi:hypothetical protein